MFTQAEIDAMLQNAKRVLLYPGTPVYNTLQQPSIANADRSTILEFEPPAGTYLYLPSLIVPILKLFGAGPIEIGQDSTVYVGLQRANRMSPDWTSASIPYRNFSQLSAASQADALNRDPDRGTLAQHLGDRLFAPQGDKLIVAVSASVAVDTTLAGTRAEFWAWHGDLR